MNRRQPSATTAETTRKPLRVRLAAIVYAVVVIMGLAGTGAHALWNQSGTAVTAVKTGSWGPQKVTGVQCSAKKDGRVGTDTLVVVFTAPSDADEVQVFVRKGAKVVGNTQVSVSSARQYTAEVSVASTWISTGTFDLSVTPSYGGTPGGTDERSVVVHNDYLGRVTASC